MKKILIPLMMGMLCAPVAAEDVRGMMEALGYDDPSLFKHVPAKRFVPPRPPEKFADMVIDVDTQSSAPKLQPEDFLQPRVFVSPESAQMIPYLLKLQKQNPTSAQLTRKLAVTCLKYGQPREALYWYIQTYQRDRSDLESLWNMAALAYQLGETEQTRKYLEEYAAADPNSAWGRMARDFLAGRFSGAAMEDGFKTEFSRFGHVSGGSSGSGKTAPRVKKGSNHAEGILIIEGKRTTVENFVENYDSQPPAAPATIKDTLKGKSGKTKVEADTKSKPAIDKAKIALPAEANKTDLNTVTTVAEPLSKSP